MSDENDYLPRHTTPFAKKPEISADEEMPLWIWLIIFVVWIVVMMRILP